MISKYGNNLLVIFDIPLICLHQRPLRKTRKQMSIYKYILFTAIFFIGMLIISSVKNLFFGFGTQLLYAIECSSYWFFFTIIYTQCKRKNKILCLSFISSTVICNLANVYTGKIESLIILRPLVMNIFLAIIIQLLLIYHKDNA